MGIPCGKLEPGESQETCLVWELQEEMGNEIVPNALFGVNENDYGNVRIKLIPLGGAWRTLGL